MTTERGYAGDFPAAKAAMMARATTTLTEFLLARIAEDGTWAHSIASVTFRPRWRTASSGEVVEAPPPTPELPARLLAECEAKRRIVELHSDSEADWGLPSGLPATVCRVCQTGPPCPTLRVIAAIYADHPDFDPDWRP